MSRRFILANLVVLLAVVLALPATASARLFTVTDPLNPVAGGSTVYFTDSSTGSTVSGSINPVLSWAGTLGQTDGAAVNFNNDFFIFDVTITQGDVDQIAVTVETPSGQQIGEPASTGVFVDIGQAPNGITAPYLQAVNNDPFITGPYGGSGGGIFNFCLGSTGSCNLNASETTVRMFVVFSSGVNLQEFDQAVFSLSNANTGIDFNVYTAIVPEPGTLLLLGAGLAALGGTRWSRRRTRRK